MKIDFRNYDVVVFILKKEEEKILKEEGKGTGVNGGGRSNVSGEVMGAVCGVAGCCAGTTAGIVISTILPFPGMMVPPITLGIAGCILGYSKCKNLNYMCVY